jgi:hypothetical protein
VKRFWIFAGASAVTLGAFALAFVLGSASFDYRRYSQHQGRLQRVMRQQPTADRLTRGLADEGTSLLAAPATRDELARVIAAHGGRKSAEIRAKAARYPGLRVYRAADMLYFIYFDANDLMRDFTCVSG